MWIFFGVIAVLATAINLYSFVIGKNYQWTQVLGLSFTSLTLVTLHSEVVEAVQAEDWVSLMDVWPTLTNTLWILTVISIVLNLLPLALKKK